MGATTGLDLPRHRLNRGGDRALNRASCAIALTRMRGCPRTRAYVARRTAEGKTRREIRRCRGADFALALNSPSAMTAACAAGIGTPCPGSEYGMGGSAYCGAWTCGTGAGASAGTGCDPSADPLTSKLGCVVISETPSMNSTADRSYTRSEARMASGR